MQLSRIYCNFPNIFSPIDFNFGQHAHRLNVVLGEVRKPGDKKRDSHNLGKTTLLNLIDFLMLRGASQEFFLVKHEERFRDFVFFLEIALNAGDFATVRRSAAVPSKISLKRHPEPGLDLAEAPEDEWDHVDLSFEEGVKLLDAWLDLRILKPYDYRRAITYFLRSQGDWTDELQLQKFQQGRDLYWKPFVAHLFGFNGTAVQRKYELDDEIQKQRQRQAERQAEVQYKEDDLPALGARISVLKQHVDALEEQLDAFRFDQEERRIMRELVSEVEGEIATINDELYDIRYDVKQIDAALDHKDKFDLRQVNEIFREANVHFPEQIKKRYEDLVDFNKKVTHERNVALRARRRVLEAREAELFDRKQVLDDRREGQLKLLRSTDTFDKFKVLQKDVTVQRAELVYLEEQRKKLEQVAAIATAVRELDRERGRVVDEIKAMVSRENTLCDRFRKTFNDYCQRVLSHEGIFYFNVNSSNNFDYTIGLGLNGQTGKTSSQGDGTSYRKLVCALFDLALLKVYENSSFFHFVYHDGVFEGLDDRKKEALLDVVRERTAGNRTQYILTLIEADLPRDRAGQAVNFPDDEIVLRLNDDGVSGRLFKMAEF